MHGRAAIAWVGVGGWAAGVGGAYLTSSGSWQAITLGALVTALGLYAILAGSLGWWYPGRKKLDGKDQISSDAAKLAQEIVGFHAEERRRENPFRMSMSSQSETERHIQWQYETDRMLRESSDFMGNYASRFSIRSLNVYDAATAAGLADGKERSDLEHPTNPLGVEHVAQILGRIGSPYGAPSKPEP
jgi:hypothetical protein